MSECTIQFIQENGTVADVEISPKGARFWRENLQSKLLTKHDLIKIFSTKGYNNSVDALNDHTERVNLMDRNSKLKFENGKLVVDLGKVSPKLVKRIQFYNKAYGLSTNNIISYVESTKNKVGYSKVTDCRSDLKSNYDKLLKAKPGRIILEYKKFFDTNQLKGPEKTPVGKAIGVEIEFCMNCKPDSQFVQWCTAKGFRVTFNSVQLFLSEKLFEIKTKGVNIGSDGSISAPQGFMGLEARVMCNADDLSNLKNFCKLLKDLGCMVNKSCGLHVHLDMREYDRMPSAVSKRLETALPILKDMMPASRNNDNQYCRYDVGSKNSSRYARINDQDAFEKYKTIEIRMHSGSINFVKISNWIKLLRSIAYSNKRGLSMVDELTGKPFVTIQNYATKLEWPIDLTQYVINRIQKHTPASQYISGANVVTINECEDELSEAI